MTAGHFCHDRQTCVCRDKTFVATKKDTLIVPAPANDNKVLSLNGRHHDEYYSLICSTSPFRDELCSVLERANPLIFFGVSYVPCLKELIHLHFRGELCSVLERDNPIIIFGVSYVPCLKELIHISFGGVSYVRRFEDSFKHRTKLTAKTISGSDLHLIFSSFFTVL